MLEADSLIDSLATRVNRFAKSGDPSTVLDPAALEEAGRLWEAAQPPDGNLHAVPVDVLTLLANLHLCRYQALPQGQGEQELRTALSLFDMVMPLAPHRVPSDLRGQLPSARPASADDAERLTAEGMRAFAKVQQTGQLDVLSMAVTAFREAVAATLPGDPDCAARMSNLGGSLLARFNLVGDSGDLDSAIDAGRQAVAAISPGDLNLPVYLSNMAASLTRRFEVSGSRLDLDAAIAASRQAVDATPQGHPNRAVMLWNLGNSMLRRFEHYGDAADLDAAVSASRQAVDATPPGHPDRSMHLSSLGSCLLVRFNQLGDVADLDVAITAAQQAANTTPPVHPDLVGYMSNLGNSMLRRFEHNGDPADLDAAIDLSQQALDATPAGHPNQAARLSNHGGCLLRRFEHTGDGADLAAAVNASRQAVDATPPDHPDLATRLSTLGNSLFRRFEYTGDGADLDAAVDISQQAVDAAPPGHPDLATMLSNLGACLSRRFEYAGDRADLDSAIDAGRKAVTSSPSGQPNLLRGLSNLAVLVHKRFEATGDSADLDAAIDTGRQAIAAAPPGHPIVASVLSNLGNSMLRRFEHDGDLADLDAAIDLGQQAVDATPADHPDRVLRLSNLANSLIARFERMQDVADLDASIDARQQAVAIASPGHPDRGMRLSNLGSSLLRRFEYAGDRADLDAAVDAGRQAVDATPSGHPGLATILSNLGACLSTRFEHTAEPADVDAAIDVGQRAVYATPPGHPDLVKTLGNLGGSLYAKFNLGGDAALLDAAIDCWRQASQVAAGTPSDRLAAARSWGAAAADAWRAGEAAEGYAAAVGLLQTTAWHGLGRATREEQLAQRAGLATDAAACAVLDGRPEFAVELLEQGRSVLWTQALNLRSDLTDLAENDPDLAERLDSIRSILDTPMPDVMQAHAERVGGTASSVGRAQQDAVELRRRKAREWDDLLAQIRALDGFEHFLAAIPYVDLAAAAADGPLVIINASSYGSHALIVDSDSDQARVVKLPGMSLDIAVERVNKLLTVLTGAADPGRVFQEREKDRHAILDMLDWLWEVVAEPVLTTLGYTTIPQSGSTWPRVWWCPTGPLTVLPFHAAGHHPRHRTAATSGRTDCVLDRVISSYTPTLTTLIRARQSRTSAQVRHLSVGMPTTPGQPPLPAAPAELAVLARHFPPGQDNRQIVESHATRAKVLAAVADHSWLHLACHATQEQSDPDDSGFILWDGTLTIADLAALPTQARDLAFLSACQTATGSMRHLDEAIHLAAAMQFLGYQHVIATLWTIADSPAPNVADAIYADTITGSPVGARQRTLACAVVRADQ